MWGNRFHNPFPVPLSACQRYTAYGTCSDDEPTNSTRQTDLEIAPRG